MNTGMFCSLEAVPIKQPPHGGAPGIQALGDLSFGNAGTKVI
jgi:hypothetical protein